MSQGDLTMLHRAGLLDTKCWIVNEVGGRGEGVELKLIVDNADDVSVPAEGVQQYSVKNHQRTPVPSSNSSSTGED